MTKHKILVVEPDEDIRNMLDSYFTNLGYDMITVKTGEDALALIATQLVDLIILEIELPNMSGYDVCRELRTNDRTKYIPIILLTEKDERREVLGGPELGADDYVTIPFDIEELKLRIQNAIKATRNPNVHSVSNFPTGDLFKETLREVMVKDVDSSYIDIKITNLASFKDVYGWQAGDDVIRVTAQLIVDALAEYGTEKDFAGHPGTDNFVIISHVTKIGTMIEALKKRFNTEVQQHYSSIDRERGYILVGDDRKDLMTLATGSVSTRTHQFADIREVVELAIDDRRRKSGNEGDSDDEPPILTAW